ncbi:MAG: cupin domain-containing protein [Hyphomicrobiaceae bacterium]
MKRLKPLRSLTLAAGLAAAMGLGAGIATAALDGPTEPKGISDTLLGSIDLSKEIPGLKDRQFRLRYFTIDPGGIVPVHSHKDRPAMFYILQGTVVQHRSDQPARALKKGDVSLENHGVEHWWENKGDEQVVLIVADILHTKATDAENM